MTLSFSTILLIKTLWMGGIAADAEPFKWLKVPEAKTVVRQEMSVAQCEADGSKWRNDVVRAMLTKKVALPLDALKYQCIVVAEGGTDI